MEESDQSKPESPSSIQFQLIPISENPNVPAVGEVIERKLKDGVVLSIGRLVVKDGQQILKGNKMPTEDDIWLNSKVVSRNHAEIWMRDQQLYVRDIGSSSGTFLNKMRLSPSSKESRPYAIKKGDIIQFGVDFKGKSEDVYKSIILKLGFHDQSWIKASRNNANQTKFKSALKSLLSATNPYASAKTESITDDDSSTDCCICIGPIAPYQALFVSPCSHCFHFKCVSQMIIASPMFQCPLCRQVANLTASVSMESLIEDDGAKQQIDMETFLKENDPPGMSNSSPSKERRLTEHMMQNLESADSNPSSESVKDDIGPEGERRRTQSADVARRPSLTMRLAELLGRQMHATFQSFSADHSIDNDTHSNHNSTPLRLTPRSETPHFTSPSVPEEESKTDLGESVS